MAVVPRVVIVGGGMGGIAAATKLARAPVEVTLVDSRNYYLFQPLIYEVAGAIVNIEDVTHAIRGLLRGPPGQVGSVASISNHRGHKTDTSGTTRASPRRIVTDEKGLISRKNCRRVIARVRA